MRIVVVIRTYAPTDAAVRRIASCVTELKPCGIDVWASVDETRTHGKQALSRLQSVPGLLIHSYDQEEVLRRYPAILEACAMLPAGISDCISRSGRSIAWGFHCECILCWWVDHGAKYDFVWVLEDDVGCDGSLAELLACYGNNEGDLISQWRARTRHRDPPFGPREAGWNWAYSATPGYLRAAHGTSLGSHTPLYSPEMVQRMSRELLEALQRWASAGRSAWSEEMTPTVCMMEGLRFGELQPQHIGTPCSWNGRVSAALWAELSREPPKPGRSCGRLYHALKF